MQMSGATCPRRLPATGMVGTGATMKTVIDNSIPVSTFGLPGIAA